MLNDADIKSDFNSEGPLTLRGAPRVPGKPRRSRP